MKKIFYFISAVVAFLAIHSCSMGDDEDTWETYADWRKANLAWVNEQAALKNADGTSYYTTVQPNYEGSAYVLMHYFEDPSQNADNLQPMYTSSCTVNYTVRLYEGTLVDSAANYSAALNSGLISGWAIALQQMHVGDTAQIIMPYEVAYGSTGATGIYPYSALQFNVRLVDIANYETRP